MGVDLCLFVVGTPMPFILNELALIFGVNIRYDTFMVGVISRQLGSFGSHFHRTRLGSYSAHLHHLF